MKMIEIAKTLAELDEVAYEATCEMAAALRAYRSTFPQTKGRGKKGSSTQVQAGEAKPKRIRRTKAQIEADKLKEAALLAQKHAEAQVAGNSSGASLPIEN